MPIKSPPANADNKLVRAFHRALENDGKVTENDIKTNIEPLIKDGRGLSAREKATIQWAVEEFKITKGGKQALSDVINDAAGKPVFEWQRKLGGAVGVRLGEELPRAQLDKKAVETYTQHCKNVLGFFDENAKFEHPSSGNGGTHVSAMEGAKAELMLRYLTQIADDPKDLKNVTTETHAIYSVYESDDESHYGGIIVDKKTGESKAFDAYNIVDIPGDREMYEKIFGKVLDADGKPVTDEVYEEKSWDFDIDSDLTGGRGLNFPHFTTAMEKRRTGELNDARAAISDILKANPSDRLVSYDYDVLPRTTALDKDIPGLVDAIQSRNYDDKDIDEKYTVKESFRKFTADDKAAVMASFKAGSTKIKDSHVENFLEGLGNSKDFQYASVEIPMTIKSDANRNKKVTVTAHIIVNTKEGDYLTVYDRIRTKNDG